jgi:hypothetical protein
LGDSDGSRFEGVKGLRALVVAHREDFVRTFTDRLLAYATGRGTESYDWPAVRRIVRDSAAEDHRWSAIILGIVRSVPFGWSTGAGAAASGSARTFGQ